MAGSTAEREIRDAVAARIRRVKPEARVIHELVVGGCRADLAAVEPERLTLFEIKSERDKLTRLERQAKAFKSAAHEVVVVAHAKWFEEFDYNSGEGRGFRPGPGLDDLSSVELWRYPEPQPGEFLYRDAWHFHPRPTLRQPHAERFLDLLWRDELAAECFAHRISASARTSRWPMIEQMAYHMTGKEIARAVCRQLRQRAFPEADAPLIAQSLAA